MIFDQTLIFSDAQAITGDAPSTNVVDLGATGTPFGGNALTRDIGKGTKIPLALSVGATFDNLTTLTVIMEVDDNDSFSSAKEVAKRDYALAELTAGSILSFPDCVAEGTDERYFRLRYDVTGTNPTAGNVTAGIVAARQSNMGDHY